MIAAATNDSSMARMFALVLGACAVGACASSGSAVVVAQAPFVASRDPRELAVVLLEQGIGQARPDIARASISPHYRQHNPRVPDGPEGLIGFIEQFAAGPRGEVPHVQIFRTVVDTIDGVTFVACSGEYIRNSRHIAALDLFRVEDTPDGPKLAEHWDAGRSNSYNSYGEFDGAPRRALADDEKRANEALARDFVLHALVDTRIREHEPAQDRVTRLEILRVLAESDLVLLQSRGVVDDGEPAVVYDLFRVAAGKLAEHWEVHERVPPTSANSNGMW